MHVRIEGTATAHLLFELGFDGVEGEVFPAIFCLEGGECEAVLEVTGDLFTAWLVTGPWFGRGGVNALC